MTLASIVAPGSHICVTVMGTANDMRTANDTGTANDMYRTAPGAVSNLFVLVFFVLAVVCFMLPQVNGRIACRS
jgi:hypothetical protein